MSEQAEHPDWLAVGQRVKTVRWLGIHIDHEAEVIVTRHTRASVFVRYPTATSRAEYRYVRNERGGKVSYFARPSYMHYVETLEPLTEEDRG